MPTAYTPNLDLNLPEIGASRDTWGALLNANFSTLDSFVSMAMPVGSVLDYAGSTAPSGWLIADGRLVSRATYSALFAVLGTVWGTGDGTSTFALPNLCGRSSVGPGTLTDANGNSASLSFGQVMGAVSYRIQQAHLPNYAIGTDTQGYHNHGGYAVGGNHTHTIDVQGFHNHGGVTQPGANHTHSGTTDYQGNHAHSVYGGLYGGGSSGGAVGQSSAQWGQYLGYTDTQGNHYHNLSINSSGNLQLNISGDGSHTHNNSYSGNLALAINGDGSHSHTIYLGGSSAWFPTQSPIIVVTKIIYAGQQAALALMALATTGPTVTVIDGANDELLAIREELAQLRAMVSLARGPAQPRRMAAPLRGPY